MYIYIHVYTCTCVGVTYMYAGILWYRNAMACSIHLHVSQVLQLVSWSTFCRDTLWLYSSICWSYTLFPLPSTSWIYNTGTCMIMCSLQNLDLGVRTDGARVNDVILPPWARSKSPPIIVGITFYCTYISNKLIEQNSATEEDHSQLVECMVATIYFLLVYWSSQLLYMYMYIEPG